MSVRPLTAPPERLLTPTRWGRIVWHRLGVGPPLVLLHGGAGSWTHWQCAAPLLAESHTLLMPDMPGFGASDLPEDRRPEILAAALREGLAALIGHETGFRLAGFSFGGLVAGLLGQAAGARAQALVLVGPSGLGLPTSRRLPLRSWRGLEDRAARAEIHRHNLRVLMLADPALAADPATVALQAANAEAARFNSRPHSARPILREVLPRLATPIGVIWGAADAVVAGDLEARIAILRAADPACPVEIIAGAGHWVAHERPAAFAAAMQRILATCAGRAARG